MKKILVTGGTGFIGSHTVVALIERGYDVVIADNFYNSQKEVLDSIEQITKKRPVFELTDLANKEDCKKLFQKHSDIYSIIHFAAAKAVGESVKEPVFYYENNIGGLLNIVKEAEKIGSQRFVLSSSCTVYGQPETLPVTEEMPYGQAQSPYGNTKKIAEEVLKDVVRANKFKNNEKALSKVLFLRYFNPIGAHESALIGELPNGVPNNLMPFITQTAAGIRECLSVFGSDYNTPDGSPLRDYIHVCDLAEAHVCAMEYMDKGFDCGWDAINLGGGKGYGVLDVIHSFEKVSGIKLNYKIEGRREGDVEKIWGSVKKAQEKLGWQARRSLDDMTLSAWRWQQYLQQKK